MVNRRANQKGSDDEDKEIVAAFTKEFNIVAMKGGRGHKAK